MISSIIPGVLSSYKNYSIYPPRNVYITTPEHFYSDKLNVLAYLDIMTLFKRGGGVRPGADISEGGGGISGGQRQRLD